MKLQVRTGALQLRGDRSIEACTALSYSQENSEEAATATPALEDEDTWERERELRHGMSRGQIQRRKCRDLLWLVLLGVVWVGLVRARRGRESRRLCVYCADDRLLVAYEEAVGFCFRLGLEGSVEAVKLFESITNMWSSRFKCSWNLAGVLLCLQQLAISNLK